MESIPLVCNGCNFKGFIALENPENPYFIVCENCKKETSQVWCPVCEIGGEFVRNINKKPLSWNCPNCKTEYRLSKKFYLNAIPLKNVQSAKKGLNKKEKKSLQWLNNDYVTIILFWTITLIVGLVIFSPDQYGLLIVIIIFLCASLLYQAYKIKK